MSRVLISSKQKKNKPQNTESPSYSVSADIEDLLNWHGKPIPKDKVDSILKDLEAEIKVPINNLCPPLPQEDAAPVDLSPIFLSKPPAYKKGDKVTNISIAMSWCSCGDGADLVLLLMCPSMCFSCLLSDGNETGIWLGPG